jgi:hypothetical protein
MRRIVVITALTVLLLAAGIVLLQEKTRVLGGTPRSSGQWITTWAGATQPFNPIHFWGSQSPPPEFYDAYVNGVLQDQTIRIVVQSTLSGSRIRIRLSNQYGKQPLTIGAARIVGIGSKPSGWKDPVFSWEYSPSPETERQIFFEGNPSIVIPPAGSFAAIRLLSKQATAGSCKSVCTFRTRQILQHG